MWHISVNFLKNRTGSRSFSWLRVVFHCIYISHFLGPIIIWRTLLLFLFLGSCELCCAERGRNSSNCVCVVLGIEPRTSGLLGKCSACPRWACVSVCAHTTCMGIWIPGQDIESPSSWSYRQLWGVLSTKLWSSAKLMSRCFKPLSHLSSPWELLFLENREIFSEPTDCQLVSYENSC